MPSGVYRLRNSRVSQPNPRVGHEQRDISGYRGTSTRDDQANVEAGSGLAPKKPDTFKKYYDARRTMPKASDKDGKGEAKSKKKRDRVKG